mmetsp:Transcript_31146/g.69010  ORF Transcript_31146/g.69010 Transcript_31146/m.69010 type:complete len:347 (-) Transcript_31146:151-1191(-)
MSTADNFAPYGGYYENERPRQRRSRQQQQQQQQHPYGRGGGRGGARGTRRSAAAPYSRNRRAEPLVFRYLGPMTSRRRNLVLFSLLGLIIVAWFLTPLSDLVTDVVLYTVPMESDIELGRESLVSMQKKYPPARDTYGVQRIGWELVKSLEEKSGKSNSFIEWDFSVVKADFANAFALPGGIVRVTDSLLKQLRLSDAEIAALIGHEMGHVIHRHSQKRLVKKKLLSTILQAVIYEDHDGYDESFGEAVSEIMLKGASWLGEQSFSRKDEYQADETAWEVLVASQLYDPRAVQGMLSKLWSLQGGKGETRWESTHPGTADRIRALQDKWNALGYREKKILSSYPMS